jgi:16S rRNA (guanine966-N2)-methyltransferase
VSIRVVSGKAKGRRLDLVPGESTRPIMDRVKTALFNIIRSRIQDKVILDLFAGTGSVGIEALSQGAASCVFTEMNERAIETLRENVKRTGFESQSEIRHTDAFKYLKSATRAFDLIYIAPPQYKNLWVEAMHTIAERPHLLAPDGQIVVQIDPSEYEKLSLTKFKEVDERKYGNTLLVFFYPITRPYW